MYSIYSITVTSTIVLVVLHKIGGKKFCVGYGTVDTARTNELQWYSEYDKNVKQTKLL